MTDTGSSAAPGPSTVDVSLITSGTIHAPSAKAELSAAGYTAHFQWTPGSDKKPKTDFTFDAIKHFKPLEGSDFEPDPSMWELFTGDPELKPTMDDWRVKSVFWERDEVQEYLDWPGYKLEVPEGTMMCWIFENSTDKAQLESREEPL